MFALAFGAVGCGGSDDGSSEGDGPSTEVSEPADANSGSTESVSSESDGESATLEDALACLTAEGIDAKDQSSNTGGEVIGIDYSGGRTTISFEESADDAEITAMVAEDYGEVIRVGSAVASIDPSADPADSSVIKSCITA
jgi:hypothetical protein